MDLKNRSLGATEKARSALLGAWNLAKEKPWIVAIVILALMLLYFFWLVFIVILAIVAFALLVIKAMFKEPAMKELLEKKNLLQEELKIAENKLLHHQLDLKAYQEISDNAQKALVEIEAGIANLEESQKQTTEKQGLESISSKKKHLLKQLLDQRNTIQGEIKIAETKYFKRKINSITYKQILKEKQSQLVQLEAEIKKIYSDATVDQIKKDLANKLKLLEESSEKKQESYAEQIFEDVSEQEKKRKKGEGDES